MPLVLTQALSDTVGVTETVSPHLVLKKSLADTVGITDAFSRRIVFGRPTPGTVGVTDVLAVRRGLKFRPTDTVGIAAILKQIPTARPADSVGITDILNVSGVFVQFDTWRPVPKPDNSLILVCRTPLTEHDSYTGQTHLTLWTIVPDGTGERPEVLSPADNGYGWVSYVHPEWSPDGNDVIVAAETSTEYQLVVLDATGFGS